MTEQILREHKTVWLKKPALRAIYSEYYRRIVGDCHPGRTLEVGGGTGNLKDYIGDVVSTDIVATPWLDAAADAQSLPFASGSFANIVAVDVLHHVERPRRFLGEVQRVLKSGGRLVLVEPAITPVSWLFYRFFHPEPIILGIDPLEEGPLSPGRKPFDANQAIPTLLFGKHRHRLAQMFPALRIVRCEYTSFFVYPLSGGFRPWSLVPQAAVAPLLRLERKLAPWIGRLMGFRLFAVLERK